MRAKKEMQLFKPKIHNAVFKSWSKSTLSTLLSFSSSIEMERKLITLHLLGIHFPRSNYFLRVELHSVQVSKQFGHTKKSLEKKRDFLKIDCLGLLGSRSILKG